MIYNQSPQFGSQEGTEAERVYPLLAGSPAIDAGVCIDAAGGVLIVDQRGYVMPVDGDGDMVDDCDMGAYEFNSTPAFEELVFSDGFEGP